MTRSRVGVLVVGLVCLLAVPAAVFAQSTIAGVVKDSSGGVLPGVTVEVTSDAIIEGTKTAVTDGGGLYKVIDLRPGVYTVTFTLTGFTTIKQTNIELPAAFTTADIARLASIPRWLAQKMAYCLREGKMIELIGKRGRANLYRVK